MYKLYSNVLFKHDFKDSFGDEQVNKILYRNKASLSVGRMKEIPSGKVPYLPHDNPICSRRRNIK